MEEEIIKKEPEFLNRGRISQTIEELYEKIILGTGSKSHYDEMDVHIPTGFCDEREIEIIRDLQDLLVGIDFFERRVKKALGENVANMIDLSKIKDTLMRRMFFLTLSSKSKNGFGIKAIGTQRQIITEDIYSSKEEEQEETAFDKFKRITTGGLDKIKQKKGNMTFMDRDRRIW